MPPRRRYNPLEFGSIKAVGTREHALGSGPASPSPLKKSLALGARHSVPRPRAGGEALREEAKRLEHTLQLLLFGASPSTSRPLLSTSRPLLCSPADVLDAGKGGGGGKKDLDAQAAEAGAPKHFFCPISMRLMRDPVVLNTGQTYDRPCIERWLEQGHATCPNTAQPLPRPAVLVPNVALRNAIEEWAEHHMPWLLVRPVCETRGRGGAGRGQGGDRTREALMAGPQGGGSGGACSERGGRPLFSAGPRVQY